jgi:ribosomal-protein-alanine N-acetyltransferase
MTPGDMARAHAAGFAPGRPWSEAEFRALLDIPGTQALGDTRCFALGRVIADEAELLTIVTDPLHRRRGLARDVLSDWHTAAHAAGAARAFLEVAANNAAARALYAAGGYTTCGRRPGYYRRSDGARIDALLMDKTLGRSGPGARLELG